MDGRALRRMLSGVVAAVAVATTSVAAVVPATTAGAGDYRFKRTEKCMMRKINHARANHGLRRLRWDKQLGYVGRRHARAMADARAIWDDPDLGNKVTRWRSVGENSGMAGGCKKLFWAFMRSPSHRANILGHYRYVGVGTDRAGGSLYAAQVFEYRRDPGNVWRYP